MSSLLINVLDGSIAPVYNPTLILTLRSTAVLPPAPPTGTKTGSVGQPQLGTVLSTSGKEQLGYKATEPDLHITCFIHVSAFALFIQYFVVFCTETAESSVSSLERPPANEAIPSTKRRDIAEGTTPKGIIQWVCS